MSIEMTIMAGTLLSVDNEPHWTRLSKPIKRVLCTLVDVPIGKIHCQTFYKKLHETWLDNTAVKSTTEEHNCSTTTSVECAICIETYQLGGSDKITTLLCGHHFCTDCIFKHIKTRGRDNVCCPMCRSNIFDSAKLTDAESRRIEQLFLSGKKRRRRFERWAKRDLARDANR